MKLRHIAFAPFHRADDTHRGMGVRLLIGRSIIEAHDGRVGTEPNWPQGAVFRLTAPSHREDAL